MITTVLLASAALAEPVKVPVQVRVLDPSGQPLNGSHQLHVSLWSDPSADDGSVLEYSETLPDVNIADGYVSVVLGANDTLDSSVFEGERWIGIAVDDASEMRPRSPVGSTPKAASVVGLPSAAIETLTSGGNADSLHTHALTVNTDNPWVPCGDLGDLAAAPACEIDGFSPLEYEYAFQYNGPVPHVAQCTGWNRGWRLYNIHPYVVQADDPSGTVYSGGAMFYTGTDASDDNSCNGTTWRHIYWRMVNGNIVPFSSNGCFGRTIYCRKR